MGIDWNDISGKSQGGSELMARRLESAIPPELMDNFQIIISRVREEPNPDKLRVLILNDLPGDPESAHLHNGGWCKFHKLVFVSHWQREQFLREYHIPHSRTTVLLNAIEPFEDITPKPDGSINIIYHTTPHRGLNILLPVFDRLSQTNKDIHLDVYSSFAIYGWNERDEQPDIKDMLDFAKNHPQITCHGFKPNSEVREALRKAHIFAYPSIWQETSCLALMEAMAAKCLCIHSDLAALPETAANWTMMYPFQEDLSDHASAFHQALEVAIDVTRRKTVGMETKLSGQASYSHLYYNWEIRKLQWQNLLMSLLPMPRDIEEATPAMSAAYSNPNEMFVYTVN